MEELVRGFNTVELVILLILGALVLVAGYRIKKIAFFVAWFILGYMGVYHLMPQIMQIWPDVASTQLFQILLPIAGGLLLALLGFSIEKICVSGICFVLTILVSIQYFGSDMQTLAIAAVVGVVIAGAAVMLMKPATIIATSGVGAYAVTIALLALLPAISKESFYWPMLIGLTVFGSVIQLMTTKRVG